MTCDLSVRASAALADTTSASRVPVLFLARLDSAARATLVSRSCHDAECTSYTDRPLDSSGNTGYSISVARLSAEEPVLTYLDKSTFAVNLLVCTDPQCEQSVKTRLARLGAIQSRGNQFAAPSTAAVVNAQQRTVAVAYYSENVNGTGLVNFVQCDDVHCVNRTSAVAGIVAQETGVPSVFHLGSPYLSIDSSAANSIPVMAIVTNAQALMLVYCRDRFCNTSTLVTTLVEAGPHQLSAPLMRLEPSNHAPMVVYFQDSSARLVSCHDFFCTRKSVQVLRSVNETQAWLTSTMAIKLAFDNQKLPVVLFNVVDAQSSAVYLYRCRFPRCLGHHYDAVTIDSGKSSRLSASDLGFASFDVDLFIALAVPAVAITALVIWRAWTYNKATQLSQDVSMPFLATQPIISSRFRKLAQLFLAVSLVGFIISSAPMLFFFSGNSFETWYYIIIPAFVPCVLALALVVALLQRWINVLWAIGLLVVFALFTLAGIAGVMFGVRSAQCHSSSVQGPATASSLGLAILACMMYATLFVCVRVVRIYLAVSISQADSSDFIADKPALAKGTLTPKRVGVYAGGGSPGTGPSSRRRRRRSRRHDSPNDHVVGHVVSPATPPPPQPPQPTVGSAPAGKAPARMSSAFIYQHIDDSDVDSEYAEYQ